MRWRIYTPTPNSLLNPGEEHKMIILDYFLLDSGVCRQRTWFLEPDKIMRLKSNSETKISVKAKLVMVPVQFQTLWTQYYWYNTDSRHHIHEHLQIQTDIIGSLCFRIMVVVTGMILLFYFVYFGKRYHKIWMTIFMVRHLWNNSKIVMSSPWKQTGCCYNAFLVSMCILIFVIFRVSNKLNGLCPKGSYACMGGREKRNFLSLKQVGSENYELKSTNYL